MRRLTSALRDNLVLRGELVQALQDKSDKDIVGALAGVTMKQWVPKETSGTGTALLTNTVIVKMMSPVWWPVIAASTPRVAGEFLQTFGRAVAEISPSLTPSLSSVGRLAAHHFLTPKATINENKAQEQQLINEIRFLQEQKKF